MKLNILSVLNSQPLLFHLFKASILAVPLVSCKCYYMARRSEHRDRSGCPIACALDIFGDHWTLLVIRNLMFLGVHEYKDMLTQPEGISTNVLSNRLQLLEEENLIASKAHEKSQRRKIYYLTTKGKSLVHIMVSIVYWSRDNYYNFLEIPEAKEALLKLGPEKFAQTVLDGLKKWEHENL